MLFPILAALAYGGLVQEEPLAQRLTAAGLKFTEQEKFYQLRYASTATKRSQTVYVRRSAEEYRSLKLNELFTLCYDSKEAPSAEQLLKIFQKRFTIGGLILEAPTAAQTNWRIRYRIEALTDLAPTKLAEYLQVVQATGDELEKEFQPGQEDRL